MSIDANQNIIAECKTTLSNLKSELDALKIDINLSDCTGSYVTELQTLIDKLTDTYRMQLGRLINQSMCYATQAYYYIEYADKSSSV